MALGPRLDLRQRQSLVMTPQLQQAIKLLQMSNIELRDFVTEELDRNPVLERGDDRPEAATGAEDWRSEEFSDKMDGGVLETPTSSGSDDLSRAEHLPSASDAPLDTDFENVYTGDSGSDAVMPNDTGLAATDWSSSRGSGGSFEDPDLRLDQALGAEVSLRDFLLDHMSLTLVDPEDKLIGQQLVDGTNEQGYLTIQLEDVVENLAVDKERVLSVLERLQAVEPSGLMARDLAECLTLQLKEKDRFDPMIEEFLFHLPLLAEGKVDQILKQMSITQEDLEDMLADIRQLNPKPGLVFGHDDAQTLIPDVLVHRGPDGSWVVDLNTETLPKVLVNNQYRANVSGLEAKEKTFLTEAVQTANWLVKALDQRANTILKVATELVKQQDGFFNHGIRYMKPLTLKDIAEAIEMHESTVSRVTNNKYMATPRGTFELKYFFTTALPGAGGGEHSSESVRYRIRELIDSEDPKKILSDDKLVTLLKAEGIDVARRTVAKYREAMNIPSSVQRRKEKRIAK